MLKAKLVVVGGDAKAAEISLSLPTVIGRGREANLTLPHPLVSRNHCELFERDGRLLVRDLKSLNGTYVDSQRIEKTAVLNPDQLLTIGNVTFRAIYDCDFDDDHSVDQSEASRVIDFDEVSSADSDSKIGHKLSAETEPQKVEPLETIQANSLQPSDIHSAPSESPAPHEQTPMPQHSIVAALNNAGIGDAQREDRVSLSELRDHLPAEMQPEASSLDGLKIEDAAVEPAEFSSIELDEDSPDRVDANESALGSFIRKLPR